MSGPERDLLRRFLSMIQVHRQDFNGRMITIRAEDLRAIACLFGVTPDCHGPPPRRARAPRQRLMTAGGRTMNEQIRWMSTKEAAEPSA